MNPADGAVKQVAAGMIPLVTQVVAAAFSLR